MPKGTSIGLPTLSSEETHRCVQRLLLLACLQEVVGSFRRERKGDEQLSRRALLNLAAEDDVDFRLREPHGFGKEEAPGLIVSESTRAPVHGPRATTGWRAGIARLRARTPSITCQTAPQRARRARAKPASSHQQHRYTRVSRQIMNVLHRQAVPFTLATQKKSVSGTHSALQSLTAQHPMQ